jgi:hypothetical protein
MDLWDRNAIDLVAPGYMEFEPGGRGRFGFIAVEGFMDCSPAVLTDQSGPTSPGAGPMRVTR